MSKATVPQKTKILLVEDHPALAELLADELGEAGMSVRTCGTAEDALRLMPEWQPDLIISDLRLPGAGGLELLKQTRTQHLPPACLIITAFGTVAQAVEALQAGADDFLTKPLDLDHLMHRVSRILETRRLREEVSRFRDLLSTSDTFHGMYGECRAMRVLFDQIRQTAPAGGPVLILGESGTGKELVARALHAESPRKENTFLAVNCAGIPENLMESEFFGHEAGSFTGASRDHEGYFRQADGGTLFLDEIAEMPLPLQAKLLRVLQDGRLRSVGGQTEHRVDVRVLAATHQDLEQAVKEGTFREDLYYRLETFTLRVPPLRKRGGDPEALAARFLGHFNARAGKKIKGFHDTALEQIRGYPFPGNVRELRNAVERAVTFCDGARIRAEHLPARMRGTRNVSAIPLSVADLFSGEALPPLEEVERQYIQHVVEQVNGNKKRAAEILGVTRNTLYRKLSDRS